MVFLMLFVSVVWCINNDDVEIYVWSMNVFMVNWYLNVN